MKLDEFIAKLTELRSQVNETKDVQVVMLFDDRELSLTTGTMASCNDVGEILVIDGVLCIERVI